MTGPARNGNRGGGVGVAACGGLGEPGGICSRAGRRARRAARAGRGRGIPRALAFLVCSLVLSLVLARPLPAQLPPDARWRTIETEHFRVNYVEGLESLARRAARHAESAYAVLATELTDPPSGRIDLLLADNVDFPNGSATPLPSNRVTLYAHPPVAEPSLAFYDDWLQLLILHELVHIFHLDQAEGIWERLRLVFGRSPALFPHFFSPGWVVEGLATYYESRLTQAGRIRGTEFDMVLRTAVLEDRFFPIDRATGNPVTWPAGSTRYIYGGAFFDFLARTYGPERVPAFLAGYGRQLVPFRLDAVGRRAFGASFSGAWKAWEDSLQTRYLALADSLRAQGLTEPELLTEHGRVAFFPRYSPNGAAISYSAATGREEPEIRLIFADGRVEEVVNRTSAGANPWFPDGTQLLFAQLNYVDPYRIYSDLYRARVGGDDRRLTRAARVWDPDLSRDGRRVVVVANAGGSNRLDVHDLASGETRALTDGALDVHWAWPRWSPAGDRVAATRWSRGGLHDVVVLDTMGAVVREITRDRAVDATPAWSPDGRYLLFSSDRTGIPNLFAYDLERDALLQVTNVLTGAFQPDVSPDGRWIAFAYYRADGYHIARIPFSPGAWRPAPPPRPEVAEPLQAVPPAGEAGGEARPYSPWPTVLPTSWSAVVEGGTELGVGAGASVFGEDAVSRHLYAAQVLAYPEGWRLAGGAGYRYQGWGNPVLDLAASQDWAVSRAADEEFPTAVLRRRRELDASVFWLRRRWRSSSWLRTGLELNEVDYVWQDPSAVPDRALRAFPVDLGGRLEAGFSSARGYGFSLGPQDGFTLSGTVEGHRYLDAFEGEEDARGYLRLTSRGRGYQGLPVAGFARHVAALRLDAGAETGSVSPGFGVGGASGGAAPLPLALDVLGGGVRFPVRGYPEGTQRGTRALSATAEYRFPLLLVERGVRLLPLFLNRVWGDVFADAGAAWCPGACDNGLPGAASDFRPLYSAGAELIADFQIGFGVPLPVRTGLAFPLREPYAGKPQLYVRIGRAF